MPIGGDAEIRTLKGAEWMGGHVMPTGEALLSGYYLNELLLRLLARDDAAPRPVRCLCRAVQVLAGEHADAQAATQAARCAPSNCCCCARSGCCPALDAQTLTLAALRADARYSLVPEAGLRQAGDDDGGS